MAKTRLTKKKLPKVEKGLEITPFFSPLKGPDYVGVEWGKRMVGGQQFEAPVKWSDLAVEIAVKKYFRRDKSVRHLIDRVVDTISAFGLKQGYFKDKASAGVFSREIKQLCVEQRAAFNSPVWFNCGVQKEPQCSACFILKVEDSLDKIFDLAKTEALIFKHGSGAGGNFSPLRGKDEELSPGGKSSGLMAFLEVLDRGAGATKSGGTTRRAAKMVVLDADHPEILEFVRWKAREELKARRLLEAGYSGGLDGEAYHSVSGQNSNNSVRVTDQFIKASLNKQEWWTRDRLTGHKRQKLMAADLWDEIVSAAWSSADPGLQFHDTINRWHTCPKEGVIHASNPCAEYMFIDDSACNLSSLNLASFLREDGGFDLEAFRRAARLMLIAQEILVSLSSYPTLRIAENSRRLRPLGLGYANLGGLLLRLGLPYDSEAGRAWGAGLTALLGGVAYATSAELAGVMGPFDAFKRNRASMLKVIERHWRAARALAGSMVDGSVRKKIDGSQIELDGVVHAACLAWDLALKQGRRFGFRNAQATALAPTGTIGLLMDCETTGIEPEFALVKTKSLVGGGIVRQVNKAVGPALKRLGYSPAQIQRLEERLRRMGALDREAGLHEDNMQLHDEHLAVFDCAQPQRPGGRHLSVDAHLLMMAAVQPFLSGAISKTVNLPADASEADIGLVYRRAWELGLKAISVYRDTSKSVQPLVASCHVCG